MNGQSIREAIEEIGKEMRALDVARESLKRLVNGRGLGRPRKVGAKRVTKRRLSAAGREAISRAAKKRWREHRKAKRSKR